MDSTNNFENFTIRIAVQADIANPSEANAVAVFGVSDNETNEAAFNRGLPLQDLVELVELSFQAEAEGQSTMLRREASCIYWRKVSSARFNTKIPKHGCKNFP